MNNINHKYLFILGAPHSGTTVLNMIVSSSHNVSCNYSEGVREGIFIPEVEPLMKDAWDRDANIDLARIKSIWRRYWDLKKPVLMDKSLPNIFRIRQLNTLFDPAYFLFIVSHPLAFIEGVFRRHWNGQERSGRLIIDESVATWARIAKIQIDYTGEQDNAIILRYEDICENFDIEKTRIARLLPELSDIQANDEYEVHNVLEKEKLPLINLTNTKIKNFEKHEQFYRLAKRGLSAHLDLMEKFNYRLETNGSNLF